MFVCANVSFCSYLDRPTIPVQILSSWYALFKFLLSLTLYNTGGGPKTAPFYEKLKYFFGCNRLYH